MKKKVLSYLSLNKAVNINIDVQINYWSVDKNEN